MQLHKLLYLLTRIAAVGEVAELRRVSSAWQRSVVFAQVRLAGGSGVVLTVDWHVGEIIRFAAHNCGFVHKSWLQTGSKEALEFSRSLYETGMALEASIKNPMHGRLWNRTMSFKEIYLTAVFLS